MMLKIFNAKISITTKNNIVLYSLIFLLILSAYWQVLGGEFISDDWPQIVENPHLKSIKSLPSFFTSTVWQNSNLNVQGDSLYRPLFLVWNFGIYSIFGPSAFWFHALLLFVHMLNALLLFLIVKKLNQSAKKIILFFGIVIFSIHPALTQAVAWVAGTDVLMSFFVLIGFLCHLKHLEDKASRWSILVLVAFSAAVLLKETAVVFPFLLWALNAFKGIPNKDMLNISNVFLFALLLAYLVIRKMIVPSAGLAFTTAGFFRLFEQVILAFRFTIVPWPLNFYFRYPTIGIAGHLDFLIGVLAFIVLFFLFVFSPKSRFGIAWFVLTMLPTLSVAFHQNGVFALRFLYLPLVGIVLAIVPFFEEFKAKRDLLFKITGITITLLFFLGTFIDAKEWKNEGRFYTKVIRSNPASISGYEGLARYYTRENKLQKVVSTYERGIQNVSTSEERATLLKRLAIQYADMGRYSESLFTFKKLNALSPSSAALIGIGNNLWFLKRFQEAIETFGKAIEFDPENSLALANYAQLSADLGDKEAALKHYRRILQLPPSKIDPIAKERAIAFLIKQR